MSDNTRWEDQERGNWDIELLREEFRRRLYANADDSAGAESKSESKYERIEPGYYWVRLCGRELTIGQFEGYTNDDGSVNRYPWSVVGSDDICSWTKIEVVGERILPPDSREQEIVNRKLLVLSLLRSMTEDERGELLGLHFCTECWRSMRPDETCHCWNDE